VTSEQITLDGLQAEPKLTTRQEFVLDLVRASTAPVDAVHVGALLCERRGRHPRDARCAWDEQNGNGALRELERKGLVRFQRGPAGWGPTEPSAPVHEPADALPAGMTTEIPY
jgi:hypothetical protein